MNHITIGIILSAPYVLRTHLHQSKKIEAGKSITEREEHYASGPAKWRTFRAKNTNPLSTYMMVLCVLRCAGGLRNHYYDAAITRKFSHVR